MDLLLVIHHWEIPSIDLAKRRADFAKWNILRRYPCGVPIHLVGLSFQIGKYLPDPLDKLPVFLGRMPIDPVHDLSGFNLITPSELGEVGLCSNVAADIEHHREEVPPCHWQRSVCVLMIKHTVFNGPIQVFGCGKVTNPLPIILPLRIQIIRPCGHVADEPTPGTVLIPSVKHRGDVLHLESTDKDLSKAGGPLRRPGLATF